MNSDIYLTPAEAKGLILSGWIRGVIEAEHTDLQRKKILDFYETAIRCKTSCTFRLFQFENGAAALATGIKGPQIIPLASVIADTVATLSGKNSFYHTCSFVVGLSESDILQDIRYARGFIDNHQEGGGIFYLDGRMLPIHGAVAQIR